MDARVPVTLPPEASHLVHLVEETFSRVSPPPMKENCFPIVVETWNLIERTRSRLASALDRTTHQLEWHHLNIAFYGETNAGKSTLIESLVILLDEAQRRARSAAFRRGENLASNADGTSIGDGRSDFTRETVRFTCDISGIAINLFDVPGIEGSEALVVDEILAAISKAHLVFYVSGRPTPPQTGADDGRIGTLEKIKGHLQDEAEVWFLFNKRVTSPRALEGRDLANAEEETALIDADRYMKGVLGPAFRGHMTASALPAFLALADCLHPESNFARQREKFLKGVPASVILKRSGVEEFYFRLDRTIVPEADRKKALINMTKLRRCVAHELDRLKTTEESQGLREALTVFCKNAALSEDEITALRRQTQDQFDRARKRICDNFFRKVREGMEKHHAEGMWLDVADEVKSKLQQVVTTEESGLTAAVAEAIDEITAACQAETEIRIGRIGRQAASLKRPDAFATMGAWSTEFMKDNNIATDSGVNWLGVSVSILPAFFGPGGWAMITVGLISSTWKLFNPRHQEAEQRKGIGQILEKMEPFLDEKLRQDFQPPIKGLQAWMLSVEDAVGQARSAAKRVLNDLNEIEHNLARIALRPTND